MILSLRSQCNVIAYDSQILVEINENKEKRIKEENKTTNILKNNKFNIKIINK